MECCPESREAMMESTQYLLRLDLPRCYHETQYSAQRLGRPLLSGFSRLVTNIDSSGPKGSAHPPIFRMEASVALSCDGYIAEFNVLSYQFSNVSSDASRLF